jgi:hypothetical protein
MESSGRNGDDAKRPAGEGAEPARSPLERSPEGRFVVRSSSHPPLDHAGVIDSSGVHSRPKSPAQSVAGAEPAPAAREADKARPGRSTPAERPRKRKELKQGGTYVADVRARCDTPRALPGTRVSDRPSRGALVSTQERPLPAIDALVATASNTGDGNVASRNVEEVTRRVRRPASPTSIAPAAVDDGMPWRSLVAAGFIVAAFMLALWLLG